MDALPKGAQSRPSSMARVASESASSSWPSAKPAIAALPSASARGSFARPRTCRRKASESGRRGLRQPTSRLPGVGEAARDEVEGDLAGRDERRQIRITREANESRACLAVSTPLAQLVEPEAVHHALALGVADARGPGLGLRERLGFGVGELGERGAAVQPCLEALAVARGRALELTEPRERATGVQQHVLPAVCAQRDAGRAQRVLERSRGVCVDEQRLGAVVRERDGYGIGRVGVARFDGVGEPPLQLRAGERIEACDDRLAQQRVFEPEAQRLLRVRAQHVPLQRFRDPLAARRQQFARGQLDERQIEAFPRKRSDRQRRQRIAREALEPAGQHAVRGVGNAALGNRGVELAGEFDHEERNTARAPVDASDLVRCRQTFEHRLHQRPGLGGIERRELVDFHVRGVQEPREQRGIAFVAALRADHEHAGPAEPRRERLEERERASVRPVEILEHQQQRCPARRADERVERLLDPPEALAARVLQRPGGLRRHRLHTSDLVQHLAPRPERGGVLLARDRERSEAVGAGRELARDAALPDSRRAAHEGEPPVARRGRACPRDQRRHDGLATDQGEIVRDAPDALDRAPVAVAPTAHRLDPVPVARRPGIAEHDPQRVDGRTERSVRDRQPAPDPLEDLVARHHPIAVLHEVDEQIELAGLERHRLSVARQSVTGSIQLELAQTQSQDPDLDWESASLGSIGASSGDGAAGETTMTRPRVMTGPFPVMLLGAVAALSLGSAARAGDLGFAGAVIDGIGGVDGLDGVSAAVESPDGRHLYTASGQDDAVTVFARERVTGALTWVEVQKDGVAGVDGIDAALDVAISPDGRHVYATGALDSAIAVFARNGETGGLTWIERKTDGVDGVSGLGLAAAIAISPDGRHLYVATTGTNVVIFGRNATTGRLTWLGQVSDGIGGFDGLEGTEALTVSPDGAHLYVTGRRGDAVAVLSRDPASGALGFVQVVRDGEGGVDGIEEPRSIAISPDGTHVYVNGIGEGAVAVFARSPRSGTLAFVQDYRGLFENGGITVSPDGSRVFVGTTDSVYSFGRDATSGMISFRQRLMEGDTFELVASRDGRYLYTWSLFANRVDRFARPVLTPRFVQQDGVAGLDGLGEALDVTASPDGAHVYVAAPGDHAVSVFRLDPTTGALPFVESQIDGAGGVNGIGGASAVAVSPDGRHLYATGATDDALAVFTRNPATGTLGFVEAEFDGVGADGLDNPLSVVVSPDGRHVYVASLVDDAVTGFARDASSGAVSFIQSRSTATTTDPLDGAIDVAISPDGADVYVASFLDDAIVAYDRNATTGLLTFRGSAVEGSASVSGLRGPNAVAVSPDGANVYVVTGTDDSIVTFSRAASGALEFVAVTVDGVGGADGLATAAEVAVTPDGRYVVVAAVGDDSVAVYARDPTDGRLSFVQVEMDGAFGFEGLGGAVGIAVAAHHVLVVGRNDSALVSMAPDPAAGSAALAALLALGGLASWRRLPRNPGRKVATALAGLTAGALALGSPASAAELGFGGVLTDGIDGVEGLDGIAQIAATPDGLFLYAISAQDDALVALARVPETGKLSPVNVQKDGIAGVDGLDGALGVAVSPDGRHVYTASFVDNAVAVFARNPVSGVLTFLEFFRDGTGGVDGLLGAASVVVSPDGRHLYAGSTGDDAVAIFARDAVTGRLGFVGRIQDGAGGIDGLDGAGRLALSPDGAHLYVTSQAEDAVAVFARNAMTGLLTQVETVRDGVGGVDGLAMALSIAISRDGAHVYVTGSGDSAVAVFTRDAGSGVLGFVEKEASLPGIMPPALGLAVSPEGERVFVGSDDLLAIYARDPATGALAFLDVVMNGSGGVTLGAVIDVAVSPDSRHVYTASASLDQIARFARRVLEPRFVQQDGVAGVDGLGQPTDVAVSPDGAHAYVAAGGDGAVSAFALDRATGSLAFVEAEFDGVAGVNGIGGASAVDVSPDGRHVYATGSADDGLAVFSRDAATGALGFVEAKFDGVGLDGLGNPNSVVVSPDGANVYVASFDDGAFAAFNRDAATGALSFIQTRSRVGTTDQLTGAIDITISPDGDNVYVAAFTDDSVVAYDRDPNTGLLSVRDTATDGIAGVTGLNGPNAVAVSPDGANVYAVTGVDDSIVTFARDGTGALGFVESIQDGVGGADGLAIAAEVDVTADGRYVVVASFGDDAVAVYARDSADGRLSFVQVEKAGFSLATGLAETIGVAVAPGFVLSVGRLDDAIVSFAPEPTSIGTGLAALLALYGLRSRSS